MQSTTVYFFISLSFKILLLSRCSSHYFQCALGKCDLTAFFTVVSDEARLTFSTPKFLEKLYFCFFRSYHFVFPRICTVQATMLKSWESLFIGNDGKRVDYFGVSSRDHAGTL